MDNYVDFLNICNKLEAQEARIKVLTKALNDLDYWFGIDEEELQDMSVYERADHKRQHRLIKEALKGE